MLTIFVVLVHLALLAAARSHPRRRNIGKSMQLRKRDNLTDGVFPYTTQLSALSIRDTARSPKIAKRTGHGDPSAPPSMFSVPLRYVKGEMTADISMENTEFNVLVDTGSTLLWVLSSECKDPKFAGKKKYVPKTERTEKPMELVSANTLKKNIPEEPEQKPETFGEGYAGNARVEGTIRSDTVTLGSIRLDNQYFGAATEVMGPYFPWEGILGLPIVPTYPKPFPYENFLHRAFEQRKISPIFSIDLALPNPQLHLGGVDHKAFTGPIEYHDVVADEGKWALENCYITVQQAGQQGTAHILQLPVHRTHIDTGSNYIFVHHKLVKEIYQTIGGKKSLLEAPRYDMWVFPCQNTPIVSIRWGKGKDWAIRTFNHGSVSVSDCVGAIQEISGTSMVGTAFLQNVYSVFDVGNMKVGFAELSGHAQHH